jgi:hypothetical protein
MGSAKSAKFWDSCAPHCRSGRQDQSPPTFARQIFCVWQVYTDNDLISCLGCQRPSFVCEAGLEVVALWELVLLLFVVYAAGSFSLRNLTPLTGIDTASASSLLTLRALWSFPTMVTTRRKRNALGDRAVITSEAQTEAASAPRAHGASRRRVMQAGANPRGARLAQATGSSDAGQENASAVGNAALQLSSPQRQIAGPHRNKLECVQPQVLETQMLRMSRRHALHPKSQGSADDSTLSEARPKKKDLFSPATQRGVRDGNDLRETKPGEATKPDADHAQTSEVGASSEEGISRVVRVVTYGRRKRARTARASIALLARQKSSSPESIHAQADEDKHARYATSSGAEAEAPDLTGVPRRDATETEMWRSQREFWDDVDNIVLDEEHVVADELL